jgi:type I restriction enzyme S subunit
MNNSWQETDLDKLLEKTIGGGTPSKKVPSFWNGTIPWASVKDFDGSMVLDNIKDTITEQGLNASASNLIDPQLPIICMRMAVGKVAVSSRAVAINQDLRALIPKKEVNTTYLLYLLQLAKDKIEAKGVGSTVKGISIKDLLSVRLIHNSCSGTQNKIAKILTTLDNVIEKTEAAIAKYEAIKQGMMHDLFTRGIGKDGQLRPRYEDAPELYKKSDLGWIPKDWEVKAIEYLCNQKPSYGINAPAVDLNSNYPNYLRITDIDQYGAYSETGRKSVNHPLSSNYLLKEGDIVFARTGATVGKSYLYAPEDGVLVYAGFLIKVSPDKYRLNYKLLKFYSETSVYKNWIITMSQRSGQPGVNGAEYGKLPLPTSKIEEQNAIVERLLSIHNKIKKEVKALSKQTQLKQGLMQDLLTGKVPVKADALHLESQDG